MTDLSSLAAAISGIKGAADLANLIRGSITTLEQAEVKAKLAELVSALADTKMQMADVKGDLLGRDEQIRELKAQLEQKAKVTFKAPFCYVEGDPDPLCAQCCEAGGKLIHLHGDGDGYWECKACERTYRDKPSQHSAIRVHSGRNFTTDW